VGHFLTRLGVYTANPLAFLVLLIYAALWIAFKPQTFEWHAVATLATWAMTRRLRLTATGTASRSRPRGSAFLRGSTRERVARWFC
jgi:hypothetical protein